MINWKLIRNSPTVLAQVLQTSHPDSIQMQTRYLISTEIVNTYVVSPTKDVLKNEENQMQKNNLNIIVFKIELKDSTRGCNPSLSNCKAKKNV
jgi:hypothetical protein